MSIRVGDIDWELCDPDASFDASRIPGFGRYRGRDEFHGAWLPYKYTFDEWSIEVEELRDGPGERVLGVVRDGGRIKGSNDEVFNRYFHVWEFRAGKIVGWTVFLNRTEALEVAGLSE
jgi:ketosteroid isomerase-like protein